MSSIYGVLTVSNSFAGGTTFYSGGVLRSPSWKTTESDVQLQIPDSAIASKLTVVTSTAQPNDDDLIITVRKNGSDYLSSGDYYRRLCCR